jgi:hypothetical protein
MSCGCGNIKFLKFNTDVKVFNGNPVQVEVDPMCNAVTVSNEGTTLVLFQNDVIQPGNFKAISGNFGEVFAGRVDISFMTQTPAPSVVVNRAVVTQKYYISTK